MGHDRGRAIVQLDQGQATPRQGARETQTPALAAVFAQMLGGEGDPAMAKAVEMVHDHFHGCGIVVVDDAQPRILGLAEGGEHDRYLAIEQHAGKRGAQRDAGDDDAIDAPLDERAARLFLGKGRAFRMGRQHGIAQGAGRPLHAHRQLGIERIGEVGHHDADGRTRACLEGARDGIGVIADIGDGALDAPARRLRHHAGTADHVGDRRFRDPGTPGDIDQRAHAASFNWPSARCRPASERRVPSSPS